MLIYCESSDTRSVFELLYGPASVFWNNQEHEGLIKWPHVSHNGLGRNPSSSPVNYSFLNSMEVGVRHQQRRRAVWKENGNFLHCIREASRPPWLWMRCVSLKIRSSTMLPSSLWENSLTGWMAPWRLESRISHYIDYSPPCFLDVLILNLQIEFLPLPPQFLSPPASWSPLLKICANF